MGRLPALFISHGMPSMAVEPGPTGRFLAAWPGRCSRPRAIVCISAHLEAAHALLTADARPVTLHDFGGFSPALHAMHYRAPGDPILASRVVSMLRNAGFQSDLLSDRGLDHGAWVPLSLMFPEADIPVVQLSVQTDEPPEYHYALGRALAPLRNEGVLIAGSGGATHDLAAMVGHRRNDPPAPYAEAFDRWLEGAITSGDSETLLGYCQSGPAADRNHPYPAEHFLPLLVAAGAGAQAPCGIRLHRRFEYGVLSLAAYQWD